MTFRASDMAICAVIGNATFNRYCEHGLLAPISGTKDDPFRFFDPRQIPQLYLVKMLRDLGLSQEQILEYGQNRTPESTARLFDAHAKRLTAEIGTRQKKLDVLLSYAALIKEGRATKPGIELRALPEQPIRTRAIKNHGEKKKSTEFLRHTCADIRQNGNAGCPMGFAFNEFLDLLENPNQPAQLVSFDPQGPETRPAGEYLVGTMNCYYGEKHSLHRRMSDYALRNGLDFSGPAYMVYLLDETSVIEPEQYLLQIAVEVKRKEHGG